ncbi:carbon-nitrogen hydrolase family protein [Streptomyces sp. NBC_01167]|uniref:carbon-nitrogen hydrolase family protein n=1 Tax=Streptomyces sp. NBC_01167 TaxID=2903756 RepID=UPI003862F24F|nr:carbon-nitrogen hydrolase family protein [Streptomyces sp. NBC_01167]
MSLFRGQGLTLAAVQTQIDPGRREENQARAAELLASAAGQGTDLACLPACFATGVNFPSIRKDATGLDGPVMDFLADQAQRHGMHIAAGVLLSEGRDIYDAAVLVGPAGDLLGLYRRASLWAGERDYLAAGEPLDAITTPLGRIGLQVSYDLRFPEASRRFLGQGVDVIVCVANLFADFSHHVRSLARARAADNATALVFSSCTGENRFVGMPYVGRSCIVDGLTEGVTADDADVLAEVPAGSREGVVTATLYPRQRRKAGAALPFREDTAATWRTSYIWEGP